MRVRTGRFPLANMGRSTVPDRRRALASLTCPSRAGAHAAGWPDVASPGSGDGAASGWQDDAPGACVDGAEVDVAGPVGGRHAADRHHVAGVVARLTVRSAWCAARRCRRRGRAARRCPAGRSADRSARSTLPDGWAGPGPAEGRHATELPPERHRAPTAEAVPICRLEASRWEVSAPCGTTVGPGGSGARSDSIYTRLSLAILQGDKAGARRIYYDEILPNRRFSRAEVLGLSYRIGAIDEGDQYLAKAEDAVDGSRRAAVRPKAWAVQAGTNGARVDRTIHIERVAAMLIPGEAVDAVFDMKSGCAGFVGITSRRVIIHDRAFPHRHQATVSIPYSKISSVAAKDEPGRVASRACWASCELILTTSAG